MPTISLRLEIPGKGWIDVAAASHQGHRQANEDNFLIVLPDRSAWRLASERLDATTAQDWPGGSWLRLAVLDGMGGHAMGREIAEAATTALLSLPPRDNPEALREMVIDLHKSLMERAGGPGISGCTLVMADIELDRGVLSLINVGDSRAWFHHRCITHHVTHDQRTVEFAYRDGEVSAEEYARTVEAKTNCLSQALGFGSFHAFSRDETALNPNLRIDIGGISPPGHVDGLHLAVGEGDLLLLGSDGMLAGGPGENLVASLADRGNLASMVERIATSSTARDNATAAMICFGVD